MSAVAVGLAGKRLLYRDLTTPDELLKSVINYNPRKEDK